MFCLVEIRVTLHWNIVQFGGKNFVAIATFDLLFMFQEKAKSLHYNLLYVR